MTFIQINVNTDKLDYHLGQTVAVLMMTPKDFREKYLIEFDEDIEAGLGPFLYALIKVEDYVFGLQTFLTTETLSQMIHLVIDERSKDPKKEFEVFKSEFRLKDAAFSW